MSSVFSLPMRDWNIMSYFIPNNKRTSFLAYLWGIETRLEDKELNRSLLVFSLPMRDWNILLTWLGILPNVSVFSLPMRDWNWSCGDFFDWCSSVFSLPMRDWNLQQNCYHLFFLPKFLAYLWGIETIKNWWKCFSCLSVFSLPMRDWNKRKINTVPIR